MPDPILIGKAFAAALVLSLVVTLLFGRTSRARVVPVGALLAVVSAAVLGLWMLGLLPHFPPREDFDRLLLIVLPAAVVAETIAAGWNRAGWVPRGVVAALAAPVLLYGSVYVTDLSGPGSRAWPPQKACLIFAALAALLLAAWKALDRLAIRMAGPTPLLCVTGAVLGSGAVVMLSGYATGGQMGVPLAAGLGGVALGSLAAKGKPGCESALGVGVVGLFALLVVGRLFAGLTDLNAALLFAAPLLGWLPEFLRTRRGVRLAVGLTLAALPVVVALVLAQQKFAADSARPGSSTEGSVEDYMNFGK
jgi:hypothetical protein